MTNHPQIIGIGIAALDVLLRLRTMPTWEATSPLVDFRLDGGGPVASAMAASARLGARVGFIGTAGTDEAAGIKLRLLESEGIDLSRMVVRDAPEDQVVAVYVHAETGKRLFSGVQRWGREQLRVDELDKDYITSADFLHLDGFHFEAALQAAQWMQEAEKTVMLDIRKTFASSLAQRGISTAVTQRLLEHSSPNLTNKVYINVDPVLRHAVEQLPVDEWL